MILTNMITMIALMAMAMAVITMMVVDANITVMITSLAITLIFALSGCQLSLCIKTTVAVQYSSAIRSPGSSVF